MRSTLHYLKLSGWWRFSSNLQSLLYFAKQTLWLANGARAANGWKVPFCPLNAALNTNGRFEEAALPQAIVRWMTAMGRPRRLTQTNLVTHYVETIGGLSPHSSH